MCTGAWNLKDTKVLWNWNFNHLIWLLGNEPRYSAKEIIAYSC